MPYTDNQRVIIRVKDVNDEPPYFINRPLPMQAVVNLNAPPATPVFTLQAKDPDTDHNLHYFLVRDRSKIIALLLKIINQSLFFQPGVGLRLTKGVEWFAPVVPSPSNSTWNTCSTSRRRTKTEEMEKGLKI